MNLHSIKSARTLALLSAAATLALAGRAWADAPQVGTVFVIAMENHNWTQPGTQSSPQQIFGNSAAPFINSLVTPGNPNAAQVSYASNYLNSAAGVHPSEPNYIWAEAGTNFNKDTNTTVLTDADPSASAKNIFATTPHLTGQMNAAGVAWKNYQEDVGRGGQDATHSTSGASGANNPYYGTNQFNYAVKHNPMAFFTDTATSNVNTFDQLRLDITADTGPGAVNNFGKYNWITPNQFNDQHSSLTTNFTYNGVTYTPGDQEAIAIGDNFLSIIVPQIMATQAYQNNGSIILWWDETEGGDTTTRTVPEIVISPLAKGNAYTNSIVYSHSSDIKTMEEIFQLGGPLNNTIPGTEPAVTGDATVGGSNDLSDLFQSGAIPATVPEPASLGILATAGCAFMFRRRSARKN